MKTFQEKEKKLYELLNKLNNFDSSLIKSKGQLEINDLKIHKNQLEIEKNNLEEKSQSLALDLILSAFNHFAFIIGTNFEARVVLPAPGRPIISIFLAILKFMINLNTNFIIYTI